MTLSWPDDYGVTCISIASRGNLQRNHRIVQLNEASLNLFLNPCTRYLPRYEIYLAVTNLPILSRYVEFLDCWRC